MEYLPEGTWNMDGGGPYNWLGKQRSGNEKDGLTRARNFITRGEVMAAEQWLNISGKSDHPYSDILEKAWKHLLLSEVSDASGWSPWPIEVEYADLHADTAEGLARQVMEALMDDHTSTVIDTRNQNHHFRLKK